MNMKKLFALLLALAMVLALCACGGNDQADEPAADVPATDAPAVDAPVEDEPAQEEEPADDRITYTVTVVDEEGNPFASTMVQMCQGENCVPAVTDADGVAVFKMSEEAAYEVKLIQMPEGYAYAEDAEVFHFASGSYEMTITLKAAE